MCDVSGASGREEEAWAAGDGRRGGGDGRKSSTPEGKKARLTPERPVVDDHPIARLQPLLPGHLGRRPKQVPQQRLVRGVATGEAGEARAVFRDEDGVHGRLRRDVAEGEALVVLVDDVGGDLAGDDLVKDGGGVVGEAVCV